MARSGSYSRIRKRTFVVTGITLLAVLLVSGAMAVMAALQIGPEDLVTLTFSQGQSRTAILGSGLTLDQAESSNIIRDASFEPLVFRKTLTVYSGDSTTLTVSSEDASDGLYGDGFFDEAQARVMTRGSNGLTLKKAARVLHYGINRVGIFQPVNLPDNAPDRMAVLAFARKSDETLAVGQNGLVIYNISGQTPEIIDSGIDADLTGVCANDSGYLACSADGDLLHSSDGRVWQLLHSFDGLSFNSIASGPDGLFVAVGDSGTVVAGYGDMITELARKADADMIDIVYGSSGFVAVGADGTILTSKYGLVWLTAQLQADSHWQAVDHRDGRYILAGAGGSIAYSDDGRSFTLLPGEADRDYLDVVMLSNQQIILLDRSGDFSVSNDSGQTWLSSAIQTGMTSQVIALAGKDKVLSADDQGQLGIAQLVAEIQLDSALKDGQFQAGDLIFLEKTALSVPSSYLGAGLGKSSHQDPWQHFGAGSIGRIAGESSPGGGESSLLIQSDSDRPGTAAIASQVINLPDLVSGKRNEVYRVELWMKQSGVIDRSVQVWLTAPFRQVGTTFSNVGATWKKYSYTFVLPVDAASLLSSEIRFNVATSSGSLWIDQVSLCLASDNPELLADKFSSQISAIAPQFIRLAFLEIGSPVSRTENWSRPLGGETSYLNNAGWQSGSAGSLHAALQLAYDSGADPWLVIDSQASQAEILNLIEYLSGPISETYGKLRMDQGSVVPWVDRFGRILVEITDSSNVFQSDQLKADYVNLMINAISQSPYYRQIKGQLIFVDGMEYRAGLVLSTADFHATDLDGIVRANRQQGLMEALTDYYDRMPRNPEKQIENWPEIMRSVRLRANGVRLPILAELTTILLADLGVQSTLSNLALPARDSQDWQQAWPMSAAIVSSAARGVPLTVSGSTDEIASFGFVSDRQISIVLTNLADSPANCRLMTDLPLVDATLYRYDSKGQLINQQNLKSLDSRQTIPPGGVILIVKGLTLE